MSVFVNVWVQKRSRLVPFTLWHYILFSRAAKKVPTISKLESDSTARQTLLLKNWRQQCQEKKSAGQGVAAVAGGRDGLAGAGRRILAG